MEKETSVRLVRNATLKIRYAGHTVLIDPFLPIRAQYSPHSA